jgi:hypothetical protein
MKFSEHFKTLSPKQKAQFAKRCDVSLGYLFRLSGGFSFPSLRLAQRIQKETRGAVQPTDWERAA